MGASATAGQQRRAIERPALTLADRARRALRALKHATTFWRRAVVLTANRALGRTFVPRTNLMTIEPTGACNLACRFCGHPKKKEGKVSMPTADFAMVLDQVAATGTSYVSLTPTTGDVFMDKDILAKLAAIESHSGIEGFEFFTNFVLADAESIAALAAAAKLKIMVISIYGHDEASFCAIADRPANQYARLVQNLRRLADAAPAFKGKIVIGLRTEEWVEWSPQGGWARHQGLAESDLLQAIRALCRHANVSWSGNYVGFDTWGGKVTSADVAGLDMTIRKRPNMPKIGACYMIFDEPIVLADGRVNACSCRALDGGLVIGDVHEMPLKDILSPRNPRYVAMVERQMRGDFPDACKGCTYYRSVHFRKKGKAGRVVSLAEFWREVG